IEGDAGSVRRVRGVLAEAAAVVGGEPGEVAAVAVDGVDPGDAPRPTADVGLSIEGDLVPAWRPVRVAVEDLVLRTGELPQPVPVRAHGLDPLAVAVVGIFGVGD